MQYRLSKNKINELINKWKTGKYNCYQLSTYFMIRPSSIRGLLIRRGFKTPKIGFKKGHIPWSKGTKGIVPSPWNKGLKKEDDQRIMASSIRMIENNPAKKINTRKKMSETRIKNKEKHPNWKGGICKNKKYLNWLKNKRNRLKRKAEGSHSFEEWQELKKINNYTCLHCKKKEPEIKLTEDHIIPLSKGGSDYIENIQPLCKSCNSKKHTKIIK